MPQILQVIGGNQPNFPPSLPNMYPTAAAAATAVANAAVNASTNTSSTPDAISSSLIAFGANPYLIGIFYMFLNLGGRYLSLELTKRQEAFLAHPYLRPFILFAVLFIATRNVAVAVYTSVFILSVLWLFANENSSLCMIPSWRVKQTDHAATDKTYEETMSKLQKNRDEVHHDDHHDDHGSHEKQE